MGPHFQDEENSKCLSISVTNISKSQNEWGYLNM